MAEINLYFPTAIYVERNLFDKKQNKLWADKISDMENNIPSGGLGWEGKTYTTHNTFNLLEDNDFAPLFDAAQFHVNAFTNEHNSQKEHTCNSAWANINAPGTYQEYHIHPNSVFSCVYYPKVPEGSGALVLENPNPPDMFPIQQINQFNDLTFESHVFTPEVGTLLIFRSYIRHCVQTGTNDESRISIALNYA